MVIFENLGSSLQEITERLTNPSVEWDLLNKNTNLKSELNFK